MTRLRFIGAILVTIVFAGISLPQQMAAAPPRPESKNTKTAIKIAEIGRVGDDDLSTRVYGLFTPLASKPELTGYVLAYAGADSLPSDHDPELFLERIGKIIALRSYDRSRVILIMGGYRETQSVELFLVPPGAVPPAPTKTVAKPKAPTDTYLWGCSPIIPTAEMPDLLDEFVRADVRSRDEEAAGLRAPQGLPETPTNSDTNTRIEKAQPDPEEIENRRFYWIKPKFGNAVALIDGAHGVIIFYTPDDYFDMELFKQYVEQGRDRIAAAAGLKPSQILVAYGGYRAETSVEYYVVFPDGKLPKAKPDER